MTTPVPKIDGRTAAEITERAKNLIGGYAPSWSEFDQAGKPVGVSGALIGVFSRFAEIIIQRLNQTPEKNFLAFLDLLGNSPLPPQPARAPLTFSLAAGSLVNGVVPAGTQVAAPPAEGEKDPVIFETERELTVTAAQLRLVFVRDPQEDKYADIHSVAATVTAGGSALLEGDTPIDHVLYLGDTQLLGLHSLKDVSLSMEFENVVGEAMEIEWSRWDGAAWIPITVMSIAPDQTTQSFNLGDLPPFTLTAPPDSVGEVFNGDRYWLRARLKTPITLSAEKQSGKVRAGQLPLLKSQSVLATKFATISGSVENSNLIAESASFNGAPVDLTKDFPPFGDRPKVGDAFVLVQPEAFSQTGATVTLKVEMANPIDSGSETPPEVNPSNEAGKELTLRWECWNGKGWTLLFDSVFTPGNGPLKGQPQTFTQNGNVTLVLPNLSGLSAAEDAVGKLRVRIVKGNYGKDASYTKNNQDVFVVNPPTFGPPVISKISILSYTAAKSATLSPVVSNNNFYLDVARTFIFKGPIQTTFKPFRDAGDPTAGGETRPALYLGFTLPEGRSFPQRTVSQYFGLVEPLFGEVTGATASSSRPRLVWEYWNGLGWTKLTVRDDTAALTRSGLIEFLPPGDFLMRKEFGQSAYWLRARWEEGDYPFKPRARHIRLNTTMAAQTVTLTDETLGSSDGSANQKFRATRAPIISGQSLEVRESEAPSAEERKKIMAEEGKNAITVVPDAAGRPKEIWVRWHEVPDFYASGPRDRHYGLDHQTGEIRFGDGAHGLIPQIGVGNLRLARYQTGGGKHGNKPAGAIIQLKTTVPYVDKATNHEPASGGADAETLDSLIERAPRAIRHHGRAVTVEDFEDLAKLATPEVARAKCVPLRNLLEDPFDENVPQETLPNDPDATKIIGLRGHTSVIVVPRLTETKPVPSQELIDRVQAYLEAHAAPTAHIWVVGPMYIPVSVEAEIALVSLEGASTIEQAVLGRLGEFLHPLTGGLDGTGWGYGREPHLSDLYALIESVAGVDHIRSLRLSENEIEDEDKIKATGRFLVYSGTHQISLVFEED
jgi:hypothetical protein